MTILGISIGTSRIGVCVLVDGVLLDRHVHDYPAPWSDMKMHIILNRYRRYLHKYQVTAVIVKTPPLQGQTKALRQLIRQFEATAKKYYSEFERITKQEIKCTLSLHSTEEMVRHALFLYRDLSALYEKGVATNHAFHRKVFEAVLAAHIYNERKR